MYISKYIFTYRLSNGQHLIFNSLSGAMDIVEEHISHFLNNTQPSMPYLSGDELQFLHSRSYLFSEPEEEQRLIDRYKENLDEYGSNDLSFVFCPSMTCNLQCVYCFESTEIRSSKERMTEEQVHAAFLAMDQIVLNHGSPKHHFIIFGGEPLLPPNLNIVELILKKAKEREISGAIISNGVFLSHYQDVLQRYKDILKIQLTIDGPQEIHDLRRITKSDQGTFQKIVSQIDWYLNNQFDIDIRVNLDGENIEYLDELLDYFQDRKWNKHHNFSVALSPVENYAGNSAPNLIPNYQITEYIKKRVSMEKLRMVNTTLNSDLTRLSLPFENVLNTGITTSNYLPNFHFCEAAGGRTYIFSPDNQVYPCSSITGQAKWSLGTYYPQLTLDEHKLALWNQRHVLNQPGCKSCSIAFLCSGNCPVQADRMTGSILGSYCGNVKQDLSDHLDMLNSSFVSLS